MRIQPKVQHQEANLKFWRTVAICLAVLLGATLPLLGGTLRSLPTITRTTGPDIVAHSNGKEAQEPVHVFFGVLSASTNRAARDAIREGWGSTAAIHKLLFVVSRPSDLNATQFDELRAEVTEKKDMLLLPLVIDDYKNITHLTLEICRVASADRSVTHVFKTDDDSFVKVDEVIQELEQAPRQLMQWGHYCEGDPMNRDPNSKHYEDPETWPNGKSPKYCRGMGYALSIDLAREVAAGAALKVPRWQRILDQPLEDRAMGLWLEFIEKDRGVQISRVQAKDRLSEYGCKDDAFVSHHVTPDTLRCTWLSGGRCCDKVDHVSEQNSVAGQGPSKPVGGRTTDPVNTQLAPVAQSSGANCDDGLAALQEQVAAMRTFRIAYGELYCKIHNIGPTGGFCLYNISASVGGQDFLDENLCTKLAALFAAKSVCDFGAGKGQYGACISKHNTGVQWIGYDGAEGIEQSTGGNVNFLDLAIPQYLGRQWDWVLSLEVGEHIPKEFEAIFLDNIARHAVEGVVLSWAVPGQEGHYHVNNHDNDYVIDRMAKLGFKYNDTLSNDFRATAVLPHFHNTIMVFMRK